MKRTRLHPGVYPVLVCPSCLRPVAWLEASSVQPLGLYRPYWQTLYTPRRTTLPGSCVCPSAQERCDATPAFTLLTPGQDKNFPDSGLIKERLPLVSTAVWWRPRTWKNVCWISEAADYLAAERAAVLRSKLASVLPDEHPEDARSSEVRAWEALHKEER